MVMPATPASGRIYNSTVTLNGLARAFDCECAIRIVLIRSRTREVLRRARRSVT